VLRDAAETAWSRGDAARSITLLRRAAVRQPGEPVYRLALARRMNEAGQRDAALSELETLLRAFPGDREALALRDAIRDRPPR
jgi:predicted Zn-dependent protease